MAERGRFPKKPGLFITGTDTGVGKTLVAGAIAYRLRRQGYRVGVFKPVATGCVSSREGLVSADAEFLAHCAESEFSLEQINPVRYPEPLAPWVAAERAGRGIDWVALHLAYKNIAGASEVMVVEGIGGVLVPLERETMVLDMMKALRLAVVVVARAGLGTINHTLLTIHACRTAGLDVAGIVINRYDASTAGLAEENNPRVLQELTKLPVLCVIPFDKDSSVERGRLGRETAAAAGLVDWSEPAGLRPR